MLVDPLNISEGFLFTLTFLLIVSVQLRNYEGARQYAFVYLWRLYINHVPRLCHKLDLKLQESFSYEMMPLLHYRSKQRKVHFMKQKSHSGHFPIKLHPKGTNFGGWNRLQQAQFTFPIFWDTVLWALLYHKHIVFIASLQSQFPRRPGIEVWCELFCQRYVALHLQCGPLYK